jgi:uncharacterized membrane protein
MTCLIRSKNSILILFSISSLILLLLPSTQAIDLYADVEIILDNAGFVSIEGNTNYPDLIVENSEEYTSKTQSLWTLNITKNVIFSDFVFSILLPEQAEISSVSSSGSILIGEESGNLVIKGYGSNELFSIVVEYQTEKILEAVGPFDLDLLSIVLIVCLIILLICFFAVLFFVDKREKIIFSYKKDDTSQSKLRGLNERQKKIITLLQESTVALTQTDIQRELDMPKASVSRNIQRLEFKGLIEKEQIGMSNLIRLKKS